MVNKSYLLYGLFFLFPLAACQSHGNSSGGAPVGGYWLEKPEADELRTTGKLESKCDEIKNHGGLLTNGIVISASGTVTMYTEDVSNRGSVEMGQIDFSKKIMTLNKDWIQSFDGRSTLPVSVSNGVLSLDSEEYNQLIFVVSSASELDADFKAQHACLN